MKTLFIECNMGVAGDMLMAALMELLPNTDEYIDEMNHIGIPNVKFSKRQMYKCGIAGSHISVQIGDLEEESVDVSLMTYGNNQNYNELKVHHLHGDLVQNHDHHQNHEHYNNDHHDHVKDHQNHEHYNHVKDHQNHDNHDQDHHNYAKDHPNHDHPNHDHSNQDHPNHDNYNQNHRNQDNLNHAQDHHDPAHNHNPEHTHNSLHAIEEIIAGLTVSEQVKENALAVYQLIAEAESRIHGEEIDQIHFHEVGNMDAVADIVGVCLLIEKLAPDNIIVSPVNTGFGQVKCAHGILPVPAPATEFLLQGVPSYAGRVEGELCTPTGAALVKHFATGFGNRPAMTVTKTGYGMGKKEFKVANCVRAMMGEYNKEFVPQIMCEYVSTQEKIMKSGDDKLQNNKNHMNQVIELVCNLDDMTAEEIGFASEILLEKGALDVWITPIQMKKNRPGSMFSCLCRNEQKKEMCDLIFKHTTTIGIREYVCDRYCLNRRQEVRQTKLGKVAVKMVEGYDTVREKPEYDDLAKLARENNLSLREVKQLLY